MSRWLLACVLVCCVGSSLARELPEYRPVADKLGGTLVSIGSDTMEPLINGWATHFRRYYPDVRIEVDAKGSGTAPPALLDGSANLALMSREMNPGELAQFEAEHGYLPTHFRVALDALAVYVHKDNPLKGLSLQQLDGIFSSTRSCGGGPIRHWSEVMRDRRGKQRIDIVGRDRISGTYEFFRQHALCGGTFRQGYQDQNDSNTVVWAVATNRNAIGFAGLGYNSPSVRILPLSRIQGGTPVAVTTEDGNTDPRNVANGQYPLARFMFIYVNKPIDAPLPPLVEQFLRFVLSRNGQSIVSSRFFIPIDEGVARFQRAKLAADYNRSWWQSD